MTIPPISTPPSTPPTPLPSPPTLAYLTPAAAVTVTPQHRRAAFILFLLAGIFLLRIPYAMFLKIFFGHYFSFGLGLLFFFPFILATLLILAGVFTRRGFPIATSLAATLAVGALIHSFLTLLGITSYLLGFFYAPTVIFSDLFMWLIQLAFYFITLALAGVAAFRCRQALRIAPPLNPARQYGFLSIITFWTFTLSAVLLLIGVSGLAFFAISMGSGWGGGTPANYGPAVIVTVVAVFYLVTILYTAIAVTCRRHHVLILAFIVLAIPILFFFFLVGYIVVYNFTSTALEHVSFFTLSSLPPLFVVNFPALVAAYYLGRLFPYRNTCHNI